MNSLLNGQPFGNGLNPLGPGAKPTDPSQLPPSMTTPSAQTRAPAPGSSGTTLTPQQVQSLSNALPSLSSNLGAVAPPAQQMASSLAQTAPAAQQLSQGMQQVQQSASSMAAPMQQVSQHTATATAAVQQLAAQAPQAIAQVQQIAPQATQALAQAAPAVSTAGATMGATAGTAMAGGISASQAQACNASNEMAKAAANCAAGALQTASPSKVFTLLGTSIPQGLALGIENETPMATAAVSAAMGKVVQAGQTGLQTASPSKTFTTMGAQQAAANAQAYANGIDSHDPNSPQNKLNQSLAEMNAANLPQGTLADAQKKAQAEAAADGKNNPFAQSDGNYQKFLDKMGYDKATQDRLMKKHQDQEQKDAAKPESERQKLNQSALDRTKANQLTAMQKVGIGNITNDPAKDGGLSPMGQYHKNQLDRSLADHQLGLDAVMAGKSPQGVLDDRQNSSLGAGPDVGANKGVAPGVGAPGDGGKGAPPAKGKGKGGSPMGVWGDPANGNNKVGQGSNSNNYAPDSGKMSGDGSDAGKALNQGMADGISGSSNLPARQASKMAGEVLQQTQSKLGIQSPSQEFHNIGDMSMRGWAEGIRGGRGQLDKEWDDIDKDMKDHWDKWGMFPYGLGQPSSSSGGGGGGGSSGGGGGGGGSVTTPWDPHAGSRWGPPPGGHGSGDSYDPTTATPAEERAHAAKEAAQIKRDSQAAYQSHLQAVAEGQAAAEAAFTPNVAGHFYRDPVSGAKINGVMQGFNKDGSVQYNPNVDAMVGGFGSAVTVASNGVASIANSTGLQVGLLWGRSVVTGVDSVLAAADFTQIQNSQIGSALSKTALGQIGALGPAGSGAEITSAPAVTLGTSAPTVNATIIAQFGSQTIQAISQQVVDVSVGKLADAVAAQRG